MTSATERLRELLDERGVEYKTDDRQIVRYTDWGCWFFTEPLGAEPNTLGAQCELVCMPVTPEQAVAATLGPGTCQMDAYGNCTACGEFVAKSWEYVHLLDGGYEAKPCTAHNYCPNCGRKVVECDSK